MTKLLWYIYVQPLERIGWLMVLLIAFWGLLGAMAGRKKWWRPANGALLACAAAAIVFTTLTSREAGGREIVLVPFRSFAEARVQPELYRSMLMNVFLFVPAGLALPIVLPGKWHPASSVCLTLFIGFALSAAIEWCQYRYGLGRCEVDDIIMNTLGVAIGSFSFLLAKTLDRRRTGDSGTNVADGH